MTDEIYYLAYGSNLCVKDMKKRCERAEKIGGMMLKDYELEFRTYLTVKKSIGKEVPIGIWKVSRSDIENLDMYEAYPILYRKEYFPVQINGRKEDALIYIMNNNAKEIKAPDEDDRCYQACVQGYKDFGFDIKYLLTAKQNAENKE